MGVLRGDLELFHALTVFGFMRTVCFILVILVVFARAPLALSRL